MTPKNRSHSVIEKSGGGVGGIFSRKPQQPLIEQVTIIQLQDRFFQVKLG